jgi:hypothetical protein
MKEDLSQYLELLSRYNIIHYVGGEIELKHDTLAAVIAKRRTLEEEKLIEAKHLLKSTQKSATLLNQAQLDYLQAYLPKLVLSEDEKAFVKQSQEDANRIVLQEKRRRQRVRWVVTVFMLFLIWFSGFALFQWSEAEEAKNEAEEAKNKLQDMFTNLKVIKSEKEKSEKKNTEFEDSLKKYVSIVTQKNPLKMAQLSNLVKDTVRLKEVVERFIELSFDLDADAFNLCSDSLDYFYTLDKKLNRSDASVSIVEGWWKKYPNQKYIYDLSKIQYQYHKDYVKAILIYKYELNNTKEVQKIEIKMNTENEIFSIKLSVIENYY